MTPIAGSRYGGSSGITIEPTDPEDRGVQLWLQLLGYESPMLVVPAVTARAIAADLMERADFLDAAAAERAHRQRGREDGTWGCACGWIQDKPHRDHVADMVAAATTRPTTAAAPTAEIGA